jgi:two-component system chemotaxis sensor kinase CheA
MELAGGITQDDLKLFLQEADEQLQLLDEDIVRLEKEADNPELMQEIFRAAHTLKGSSAMVGHQVLSNLAHAMENVLDNVRKGLLSVSPQVVDALLHGLDVMRVLRQEMETPGAASTDIKEAVAELNESMKGGNKPGAQAAVIAVLTLNDEAKTQIAAARQEGRNVCRIKIFLDESSGWASVRCFQIVQGLSPIADIIASLPTQDDIEKGTAGGTFEMVTASNKNEEDIRKVLAAVNDIKNIEFGEYTTEEAAPLPAPAAAPAAVKAPSAESAAAKKDDTKLSTTVRVDVSRLDTLMEQVGELVIYRNQINQLSKLLGEKYHDDEIVHSLSDAVIQIAKNISTLQQDVMSIRMLPIEIVFNTLPRMVRDIARKQNKKIDFIIEGQETEVDRSVIEHLHDPLVHLLRNSVDHGIESPEERLAAGKPETGTIRLSAYHEQDTIVIKLTDDGKGIDPAVLRESAVKKNVLTAEIAAKMTDTEIINLIFASGFSTAKKITEVSGRGVGLDVVKTNIELMSGSVDVSSEPGLGTTFTLTLPLTLAIIPALLVSTGQTTCAVPLSNIVESSKLEAKNIKTVRGSEVTLFRGNVLPLLRLDEVFGWQTEENRKNEAIYVVVVKYSGTQIGFIVDALLEQQELVVKSLDQFIGGSNGITGASILGDGKVVLILDVASLIRGAITERQNGNGHGIAVPAMLTM